MEEHQQSPDRRTGIQGDEESREEGDDGVSIEITLPFPPSQNHYYRRYRNRVVISEKGKAYREEIALTMRMSRCKRFRDARVGVHVTMHPPDRRKRDLDNFLKVLLDGITHGGIWTDDCQVDDLRVTRAENVKGGMVTVRIEEIPNAK